MDVPVVLAVPIVALWLVGGLAVSWVLHSLVGQTLAAVRTLQQERKRVASAERWRSAKHTSGNQPLPWRPAR